MPIQFAPLDVPLHRRRQTFATLLWTIILPLSMMLFSVFLYFPYTRLFAILYIIWMLFWDTAPLTGARRSMALRKFVLWKWMRDFFPIDLIREVELDPKRNYVFGCHPHGIISFGAWINFATEANRFSDLFPGLNVRLLTLSSNFKLPFFRDLILGLSIASVAKRSCDFILRSGPGNSIAIVVGGAQESLYAKRGTMDLVLYKRLGFIKLALANGAALVPVLSIGENDVFDMVQTKKNSIGYFIQQKLKNTFGWTVPLFFGRGVFNYNIGFLPHRRRIVTIVAAPVIPEEVIGCPIHFARLSSKEIDDIAKRVQQVYVERLMEVWNKYKDVYAKDRKKEMEIVE